MPAFYPTINRYDLNVPLKCCYLLKRQIMKEGKHEAKNDSDVKGQGT